MTKVVQGRWNALLIGLMILGLVLVITGCTSSPAQTQEPATVATATPETAAQATQEAPAPPAAQGSADPQKLMIPRWFLGSLTVDGQAVEVLSDQQAVTIQFEPGGKVNGTGGCNNFSATFQADYDGSMSFGPILSTKMACDGSMQLESAYFDALSKVQRFSTENGLTLSSADGKTQIVFHMPPK